MFGFAVRVFMKKNLWGGKLRRFYGLNALSFTKINTVKETI